MIIVVSLVTVYTVRVLIKFCLVNIPVLIEQPLAHVHGDPQNQGSFHKDIIQVFLLF